MQLHRYPRCKIPGASQDDCCPFRTPPAVSAFKHHISCHRSQMSLDTRSRPMICTRSFVHVRFHWYVFVLTCTGSFFHAFIFMCTHSFSLVCVRSHLYRFIYSCTCMLVLFSVVRARSNCSQLYALIFSDMHLFSVGHSSFRTRFQLDALILSLRIHSQWYTLVFC